MIIYQKEPRGRNHTTSEREMCSALRLTEQTEILQDLGHYYLDTIQLNSLPSWNSTVEITAGDLSDLLAELGIQDMLHALLVSIGDDGGQLIQSTGVWFNHFMENLQAILANMNPDSLVKLTGKVPHFIVEASDDTAADLCREEGEVESEEDDDDDDDIAMSPCSLAQLFASKINGGGSKEEYDPTPKFKSLMDKVAAVFVTSVRAPIFRSANADDLMTISEMRHEWYEVELQLLEVLWNVPFSASFENAIRSILRRLSENLLSELAVMDPTSTLNSLERNAISIRGAEKTAKTSCTTGTDAWEQKPLTCCFSKLIVSLSRDEIAIMSLLESSDYDYDYDYGRSNEKSKSMGEKWTAFLTAKLEAGILGGNLGGEESSEGKQFQAGYGPDMNGDGEITVAELKMFLNSMDFLEHAYANELDELSDSVKLIGTLRVSTKALYGNMKTALASMDGKDVLFDMKTFMPSENLKELRKELWKNTENELCDKWTQDQALWTRGLEFTPCCYAKLLAPIGQELERLSDSGFLSDFDFEGRTKVQVHKDRPKSSKSPKRPNNPKSPNSPKAIAEFFTALSRKLESAATRPVTKTITEELSSAGDNFLVELYRVVHLVMEHCLLTSN